MSKVINLLARLGADPSLQAPEALDKALTEAGVSAEIATAIKDKDLPAVEGRTGSLPGRILYIFPGRR